MSGHRITSSMHEHPEDEKRHCPQCGKETIYACIECEKEIPGDKYVPDIPSGRRVIRASSIPQFCDNCGEMFPWTREKMEALVAIAAEEESLSDADRESLRRDAPLIATDNPESEVAALRIKKIMSKVGEHAAPLMWKIVTELATEGAKKWMGL